MSIFNNNILAGAAAQSTTTPVHTIDQSIRFNAAGSAYLNRTPSSDGNRKTWTWSGWVKKCENNDYGTFFEAYKSGSQNFKIRFENTNTIRVHQENTTVRTLITNREFRDNSAWYHIVLVFDTTQTVSTERMRLYINGERETSFSGTPGYPGEDELSMVNSTEATQNIGWSDESNGLYFDGYLAEIVFLDGTATDCNSFGEFNSSGIWVPKNIYDQSFTFGTNGFYLTGQDANNLGYDYQSSTRSGTPNDFTANNFGTHDQVPDSPTNNFCTLSRINMGSALGVTLRDGNLDGRTSGTAGNAPASISLDSGKWYFEFNNHANGSGNNAGVGETPTGSFHHFTLGSGGNQINDYSVTVGSLSSGNILGFKLDLDAGTLQHTTDGSSYTTTGSLTANTAYAPYSRLGGTSGHVVFNFGQDSSFGGLETSGSAGASDDNGIGDFYYNVPSGFLAICTKNLGAD